MKKFLSAACGAALLALAPAPSYAGNRYAEPPPLVVSPDLAAPWVLQLRRSPELVRRYRTAAAPASAFIPRQGLPDLRNSYVRPGPIGPNGQRTVQIVPMYTPQEMARKMDPRFLPREVAYGGAEKPGTIIVDTRHKFLYLIQSGGKARRYGVGVGKEGFGWTGTERIVRKAEWPGWTPPREMIARERAKGRVLPAHMDGGLANPLGARALYLGNTLYRIHGTNAPWTIGHNVSSGCIRMRNQDVIDLYGRVRVGTKVVVM